MKKQKVTSQINLERLAGGAFAEKLNEALMQVAENIQNPNTEAEGRGGAPTFKLVAADGGRWEAVAIDNVKSYLMEALADIPNREQITIIA